MGKGANIFPGGKSLFESLPAQSQAVFTDSPAVAETLPAAAPLTPAEQSAFRSLPNIDKLAQSMGGPAQSGMLTAGEDAALARFFLNPVAPDASATPTGTSTGASATPLTGAITPPTSSAATGAASAPTGGTTSGAPTAPDSVTNPATVGNITQAAGPGTTGTGLPKAGGLTSTQLAFLQRLLGGQ